MKREFIKAIIFSALGLWRMVQSDLGIEIDLVLIWTVETGRVYALYNLAAKFLSAGPADPVSRIALCDRVEIGTDVGGCALLTLGLSGSCPVPTRMHLRE